MEAANLSPTGTVGRTDPTKKRSPSQCPRCSQLTERTTPGNIETNKPNTRCITAVNRKLKDRSRPNPHSHVISIPTQRRFNHRFEDSSRCSTPQQTNVKGK